MTEYRKNIAIVILIVLFVFYWYEIRPAHIRSMCQKRIISERLYATSTFERDLLKGDMNKINAYEREKTTHEYTNCIHEQGIAK